MRRGGTTTRGVTVSRIKVLLHICSLAACLALACVWARDQVVLVARDVHPPPLAIGAPAPDFALPGIDGKTYSLASSPSAIPSLTPCPETRMSLARTNSASV